MEEEFTIDDDSSSRNRNNVAINRVFKRRNSTHSQVQNDVRKEPQTISASAFPVGSDFKSFLNELKNISYEHLAETLLAYIRKITILNGRKLLLTIIWQRSITVNIPFNIMGTFVGDESVTNTFFKFLRLVQSSVQSF